MPVLKCGIQLPAPRREVFSFFADAFNLERITPPWLKFEILTPAPIPMAAGTLIDYRIRLRVIPMRWRTRISKWEPDSSFIDQQLKGPYLEWIHLHTFEENESGTWCEDQVQYRVPGGAIIDRLFVRRDLHRIFGYRQQVMGEIFGAKADARRYGPVIE
ncbi:MAG: SRPBCC family protein [Phycisphaerales bacterium]|jgi:ligand-binding SRPBCC domain-containing protein